MFRVFTNGKLRLLLVTATFLAISQLSSAQNPSRRVDLSIGWGDQMFESIIWHRENTFWGHIPETETVSATDNYRYSQHWFLSAGYRVNRWFSAGAMTDISSVSWDNMEYNGNGEFLHDNGREHFVNMILMPVVSFTYFQRPHLSMHGGLGAGLNVNTGSQTDYLSRTTVCAPAMYLNVLGIRGEIGRYFASVDFGGLVSMNNPHEIYLLGSRMISVSVGISL